MKITHHTNEIEELEVIESAVHELVIQIGTQVEVKNTTLETHNPSAAVVLGGPNKMGEYWIKMITGVQWSCPRRRLRRA